MWLYISVPLLLCMDTVISRDVGKTLNMKTFPHVSDSLINLGKVDVSIYFNSPPEDVASRSELRHHGSSSLFPSKVDTVIEEPCPCSSVMYHRDFSQNHPSALLNRILSGNDLFSFKEPNSSPLCCDSHEHVQENILLEFGPKQSQMSIAKPQSSDSNPLPFLPFLLNTFKQRPTLPTVSGKPKAVEIFFFPKKRGILPTNFERLTAKKSNDIIKIVGDKDLKNDFKTKKFVPPLPGSVKKDSAMQENNKSVTTKKVEEVATIDKTLNNVV